MGDCFILAESYQYCLRGWVTEISAHFLLVRGILGHLISKFFYAIWYDKACHIKRFKLPFLILIHELFHLVIMVVGYPGWHMTEPLKCRSKWAAFRPRLALSVDHDSTDRTRPGGSYTFMYQLSSKWCRWYPVPLFKKYLKQKMIPFFTPEVI